jgi:pyruvate ferredoxin oxidoreductase gamma subunit/phenylglyoxylate dehydrogenase gamma subunit
MHEVRIHGRGGQGAVLASKILAKALVEEGRFATAIPSFGFERRGAPVTAFLRIDDKEIRTVTNIYHPDFLICIDPTVARAVDIFAGMKDNGTWVQATKRDRDEVEVPEGVGTLALCDAIGIARQIFNRPITNSIMLGAFAKASGLVSVASLKEGFRTTAFRDAGLEENLEAIERGFEETIVHRLH